MQTKHVQRVEDEDHGGHPVNEASRVRAEALRRHYVPFCRATASELKVPSSGTARREFHHQPCADERRADELRPGRAIGKAVPVPPAQRHEDEQNAHDCVDEDPRDAAAFIGEDAQMRDPGVKEHVAGKG